MDQSEKNVPMMLENKDLLLNTRYSQITHILTSEYDVTFVFYQAEALRENTGNISYKNCEKEVARIVMPKPAALKLMEVLNRVLTEDKRSTKTSEKNSKKGKK